MNILDEFREKIEQITADYDIAAWHYNQHAIRVKHCITPSGPPSWVVYDDSKVVRGKIVPRMLTHSYTSPFDALRLARSMLESEAELLGLKRPS